MLTRLQKRLNQLQAKLQYFIAKRFSKSRIIGVILNIARIENTIEVIKENLRKMAEQVRLKGTEKQIKWAEDIRSKLIADGSRCIKNLQQTIQEYRDYNDPDMDPDIQELEETLSFNKQVLASVQSYDKQASAFIELSRSNWHNLVKFCQGQDGLSYIYRRILLNE